MRPGEVRATPRPTRCANIKTLERLALAALRPLALPGVPASVRAVRRGGNTWQVEFKLISPSGSWIRDLAEFRASLGRSKEGKAFLAALRTNTVPGSVAWSASQGPHHAGVVPKLVCRLK